MSGPNLLIILMLMLGILGKSNIIAAAAAILLVLRLTNLEYLFPVLEKRGLEVGLLFLVISVLIPLATDRIPGRDILRSFLTLPGLIAMISGALATHLNGKGLKLLQEMPELMIGLIIGSIIGIVFLGGIPVGPLMAGGIAALLMELLVR
ncbi:DUF441 domain-containing protein [Calderihabitans maritimus]|uniref:UPF0756 membrane protein KKC1_28260 n=1 Tax=Calderihabitans maritimus TaxID=1246530 RepID=A0A1Z5HWB4_9FIRM|nr:predicted membrane protein [Calderihabitans maritimus]